MSNFRSRPNAAFSQFTFQRKMVSSGDKEICPYQGYSYSAHVTKFNGGDNNDTTNVKRRKITENTMRQLKASQMVSESQENRHISRWFIVLQ